MVLKLKMGLKTFLDLKNLVIDIVSRIGNKISSLSFFKYLLIHLQWLALAITKIATDKLTGIVYTTIRIISVN